MDNVKQLREFLWCNHAPVSVQSVTKDYAHVSMLTDKAIHIVIEENKVKILCHSCFCDAMQKRFDFTKPVRH